MQLLVDPVVPEVGEISSEIMVFLVEEENEVDIIMDMVGLKDMDHPIGITVLIAPIRTHVVRRISPFRLNMGKGRLMGRL